MCAIWALGRLGDKCISCHPPGNKEQRERQLTSLRGFLLQSQSPPRTSTERTPALGASPKHPPSGAPSEPSTLLLYWAAEKPLPNLPHSQGFLHGSPPAVPCSLRARRCSGCGIHTHTCRDARSHHKHVAQVLWSHPIQGWKNSPREVRWCLWLGAPSSGLQDAPRLPAAFLCENRFCFLPCCGRSGK